MVKRWEVGDEVNHLVYGNGVVQKDVSNETAEVYEVVYEDGRVLNSSEGLMTGIYR